MPNMANVKSAIYLIGVQNEHLDGKKLPTNREVLSVFFYKHSSLNLSIRDSAIGVVKDVINVWNRAGIPVCRKDNAATKLQNLYKDWQNLQRNRLKANSLAQKRKETYFATKLDCLFDIARHDAMQTLTECQRQFLVDQRGKSRCGFVFTTAEGTENMPGSSTHGLNERQEENDGIIEHMPDLSMGAEAEHIEDDDEPDISLSCSQTLSELSMSDEPSSQSSIQSELKRSASSFEYEMTYNPDLKPKRINIVTTDVAIALDRTNTPDRSASYILTAVTKSCGLNPDNVNLSRSAIRAQRIKVRALYATQLKENIQLAKCLVIHWDGKILPEIDGSGTVERLPVVISGLGTEQLLGAPKLDSGRGVDQAAAVIEKLNEWNVSERIKAICFDTTPSNTGPLIGTCKILEEKLGRNFLHLACRHHIYELLLKSAFETCWDGTSGPNVQIFTRIKTNWDEIDKSQYETGMDDELVAEILEQIKDEIRDFISNQFEVSQPRDDYRELLELTYIFLRGKPPRGVTFKAPGAMHHARWMSKAIYSLKMYLFKSQFHLTRRETTGLRNICIFIAALYVKSWFNAPCAIKAPFQDLTLLQDLVKYKNINAHVADKVFSKLAKHLWYLSEDLVALAFFDDTVPNEVKLKMAQAIKQRESTGTSTHHVTRTVVAPEDVIHRDISDFVTKKSVFLFDQFGLSYDFLDTNPESWKDNDSFKNCLMIFKDLKVVNDIAERAVALVEEYNKCLTKNEEQAQYLLQVVKNHRKKYPNCNKTTLLK